MTKERELLDFSAYISGKLSDDQFVDAVNRLKVRQNLFDGEVATIRREVAISKLPKVIKHLEDCLSTGKKIVCFAHHRQVITEIHEHFGDGIAVKLLGGDTLEQRQKAIDSFQNDKKVKLFVGSILAAGVGITLTASKHIVFAELDWVPGNMTQAEDRCHRIGSEKHDSLLIQHIVLGGSIDAYIAKIVVKKQKTLEAALDRPEWLNKLLS